MVTEEVQGISGQKKLRENVVRLYASIAGYGGEPTESQQERLVGFRNRDHPGQRCIRGPVGGPAGPAERATDRS